MTNKLEEAKADILRLKKRAEEILQRDQVGEDVTLDEMKQILRDYDSALDVIVAELTREE